MTTKKRVCIRDARGKKVCGVVVTKTPRRNPADEPERTPTQVQECVVGVVRKGKRSVGSAFAICVAQGQKTGHLKAGRRELTAKGKRKEARYAKSKRAKVLREFERALEGDRAAKR